MKDVLITLAKGLWIGGTLTVPGVSGGAMAMILNIYDRLVISLNSLFRRGKWQDKKKSLWFLLAAGVGGLVGFVVFSRLVGIQQPHKLFGIKKEVCVFALEFFFNCIVVFILPQKLVQRHGESLFYHFCASFGNMLRRRVA